MKFNSVKEYFLRLNNTGYQLMMVPLIVFIFHYASIYTTTFQLKLTSVIIQYMLLGVGVTAAVVLTVVHFYVRSASRKIAQLTGLGIKLERIGNVLLTRLLVLASVVLIMPVCQVLTHHIGFAIGFMVTLGWYFINWPRPSQVSNLLQLKGDEKEMVLSKGEAFR